MSNPTQNKQRPLSISRATKRPQRYKSKDLFSNNQEIVIEHAGQEYRLRITRQDKLILTK